MVWMFRERRGRVPFKFNVFGNLDALQVWADKLWNPKQGCKENEDGE